MRTYSIHASINATQQFMRMENDLQISGHIPGFVEHLSNLHPGGEQLKRTGQELDILDHDFPGWHKKITPNCAKLLHLLYINSGTIILKTLIYESIGMTHSANSLDVMVFQLRKYLRSTRPDVTIETVFRTGYRLIIAPDTDLNKFTSSSDSLSYLDVTLTSGKLFIQNEKQLPIHLLRYKILAYLILRTERLIPNDEILEFFYGPESTYEKRTLDVHISRIRSLLKDSQVGITCIHNVGYVVSAKDDVVTIGRIRREILLTKK